MSAQAKQVMLNFRDIATALVRHSGLHEGHWRLALTFGPIAALNANISGRVFPSAIVPVIRIGLIRDEEASELSVDAEVVNPKRVELTH